MRGDDFAFTHLREFESKSWESLKAEARADILPRAPGRIVATDADPKAVDASHSNAHAAGVEDDIEFGVCDFRDTPVLDGPGMALVNPEYGLRLGDAEVLGETYKALGDFLKQRLTGYRAGIFTANTEAAKRIGLKPRRKHRFFSAKLACTLYVYELWAGSRK